jgi:2-polyprenyl-6-methoxyphenol hydroxylase-like FAD-dependent oxidoreductase
LSIGRCSSSLLANECTQALEDGVTLAICLKRAGKDNVPLAVRAYQEIRYDRVKAVQKMGETTRDMWHKADWDKVKKDPKSIELPREDWVLQFDAERHAEDVFDEIVRNLA